MTLAVEKTGIAETDLRSITRDSRTQRTVVTVHLDWQTRATWLVFGQGRLRFFEKKHTWQLAAFLKDGASDFEHDSAFALQLPLIGLQFEGTEYHQSTFVAWVDPNGDEPFQDFRVPRPGYNPMKHKDAILCRKGRCKEEPHIMVPEGFYVPKYDPELYRAVRGKKVEISIGPAFKDSK